MLIIFVTMALKFTAVSSEAKVTADKSKTIAQQVSPFQHGVQFTIEDYSYTNRDGDPDHVNHPVFITSIGNLFLSTIRAEKVAADGKPVSNDGVFNTRVKDIIKEHLTTKHDDGSIGDDNGTILNDIVQTFKGQTLVVRRVPYNALSRDGKSVYAASLVCIDC